MATNPFEKFRTKIAEGLFALNTKLFADGEKVSGDNPLPMKQYGSIVIEHEFDEQVVPAGSSIDVTLNISHPVAGLTWRLDESSLNYDIKMRTKIVQVMDPAGASYTIVENQQFIDSEIAILQAESTSFQSLDLILKSVTGAFRLTITNNEEFDFKISRGTIVSYPAGGVK